MDHAVKFLFQPNSFIVEENSIQDFKKTVTARSN